MPAAQRQTGQRQPGNEVAQVHQAVAERGSLTKFIQHYQGEFSAVMPAHTKLETFVGLAAAALRRDAYLNQAAQRNPFSLMIALRECAALGHVPIRGTYALVPFNRKRDKVPEGIEVVGIEEVGGVIERMYRAGAVVAVHAEVVRQTDVFHRQPMGLPVHEFDPLADPVKRGALIGVYAWAQMHTGALSQVVIMGASEVLKHRNVSRSGDAFWGPSDGEGPWTQDMWRKTALHKLEKYVPTSSEYRMQMAQAEALGATSKVPAMAGAPVVPAAYLDADVVEGDWPDTAQPGGGEQGEQ